METFDAYLFKNEMVARQTSTLASQVNICLWFWGTKIVQAERSAKQKTIFLFAIPRRRLSWPQGKGTHYNLPGDLDANEAVNISDVTSLIDRLLSGN